jgi:CarboxypepD_reg-like domain
MKTSRYFQNIFPVFLFTFMSFLSQSSLAQAVIKGNVIYENDAATAGFVTIELVNDKTAKAMSDSKGNFHLYINEAQKKDSLVITAVGYKNLKMPVTEALHKSVFTLTEAIKTIEDVTVFSKHEEAGAKSEVVGYFRGWDYKNTGGEIGRFFYTPYKKFKIDKVRFKASNTCDSCLLRLHIRYVNNGEPGVEMFHDSISLLVSNLTMDSKISEFDLTPYDYTFRENNYFISIEVLNCGNGKKGFCAYNFAGTEKGLYVYKPTTDSKWEYVNDYTIYLKLFLRF